VLGPGLISPYEIDVKKAARRLPVDLAVRGDYLFITYIVTSKPNLISVADGVVHMVLSP
jgi:hypothetical protein